MEIRIPLFDKRHNYLHYKAQMDEALHDVLDSGAFKMGNPVKDFEDEFARYCGATHCLTTTSGTQALHFTLRAFGIGSGDEVITVANTCVSTGYAIEHTGAKVRFVDIDPDTLNIDVDALSEAVTPKTRALVPVHMYGLPADMDPINDLASQHGIPVIEDAALAPGAVYKGKRVGSLSDAAIFSFGQSKVLSGIGSGGAAVTNREDVARRLGIHRNYGRDGSPYTRDFQPGKASAPAVDLGFTGLIDTLQAAALRVRLQHLEEELEQRRAVAAVYDRVFQDSPVTVTTIPEGCQHVYRSYVVRVPERDRVLDTLLRHGIEGGLQYVPPIHLTPFYRRTGGYREGAFPVTEKVAAELLCLPCTPGVTPDQAVEVATCVIEALN